MVAKEPHKQTWKRNIDFLFVTVGLGVGFGNVWRFPYICHKNGGGVFLIPYLLAVLLLGLPQLILEGSVGQFMSRGVIGAYKIVPLFQGVGYMITVQSLAVMCYYAILFVWVLYYLFSSMTSVLPWSHCNNTWNTPDCRVTVLTSLTNATGLNNITQHLGQGGELCHNMSCAVLNISGAITDPATEFWERKVLASSPGIDQPGVVHWDKALCLLLAWVIIYFCIWKGASWVGKISYVTSVAPYFILLALLIRGITLDGAVDGIKYYLLPNWSKLGESQVWLDACVQVLWSYAIGIGVHTSMGRCNEFHHNIIKHYVLFSIICSVTSFLCGFVIFSVLGFMAKERGVSVDAVAASGPGLAFIVYPQAIQQMPWPTLWAVLFFLFLVLVAVDSEFASVEAIIVTLLDVLPSKFSKTPYRELLVAIVCTGLMLLGLSMVTEGGIYVEQLLEWYISDKTVILTAFLQCVVVSYIYGANRFQKNLEFMLGYRIGPILKYVWLFVTPVIFMIMWATDLVVRRELTYRRSKGVYHYPPWTGFLGWFIVGVILIWLPGVMVWRMITTPGTFCQRLRYLLKPEFTETQRRRDLCILETENPDPESIPLDISP